MKSLWLTRLSRRFKRTRKVKTTSRFFIPSLGKRFIVVPFSKLSFIPIVLLIVASGYLLARSDIFLIKQVEVNYSGGIANDEEYDQGFVGKKQVHELVSSSTNARSVLGINTESISEDIMGLDPVIDSVEISRKLPDTLVVSVSEHTAVAMLVVERREENAEKNIIIKEEYYLIDDTGVLFKNVPRTVSLPRFRYQSWVDGLKQVELIGIALPKGILEPVLETIQYMEEETLLEPQAYLMVDDFTLNVQTKNNVILVLSFDKSLERQIDQIVTVTEQVSSEDKKIRKIDTRFDKIFIEYD